jgi:hypothetical protein
MNGPLILFTGWWWRAFDKITLVHVINTEPFFDSHAEHAKRDFVFFRKKVSLDTGKKKFYEMFARKITHYLIVPFRLEFEQLFLNELIGSENRYLIEIS